MDDFLAKTKAFFRSTANWFNTVGATLMMGILMSPEFKSWVTTNFMSVESFALLGLVLNSLIRTYKTDTAIHEK
jgi:hypothetical protein